MNAMQYKIMLPDTFDMDIIRERVKNNGHKTDGFQDLLFKAYLIQDSSDSKQYAPLYIWKDASGMNKFIFEGFYDNILNSFGWQNINIAVPLKVELSPEFDKAKYLLEIEHEIAKTDKMSLPQFSKTDEDCLGKVLVYNPDKWKYVEFYFYEEEPEQTVGAKIYEILHISQ